MEPAAHRVSSFQQGPIHGHKEALSERMMSISHGSRGWVMTHLLSSSGLRNSQAYPQHRIGAELRFILRAVKIDQEVINGFLILDIQIFLDELRTNHLVDVLDSLQDSFSAPFGFVSISELVSFVLPWKSNLSMRF